MLSFQYAILEEFRSLLYLMKMAKGGLVAKGTKLYLLE
jgi:hypothetical protein